MGFYSSLVVLTVLVPTTATRSARCDEFGITDESAVAEQLRKRGADVTESNGLITGVTIKNTSQMTVADFQALGRLTAIKTLQLSGDGATLNDETLGLLTGLSTLEDLSTNAAQFSDDGLRQLTKLTNLKQIKFFHTSLRSKTFTGAGLAHLAELKNLRRLTVAGCPFNDEGLAAVAKLTQLENFRTWHTYQTEAGNRHLKSLTNLRSLHLGQRLRHYDGSSNALSLTDETIDTLVELKSLDTLLLDEARLSLSALRRLQALPKLKRLELGRTDISAEEVQQLKQALPQVEVVWKPLSDEDRVALGRLLKP